MKKARAVTKSKGKGKWKIYVGVFCVLGAVVMLTENIVASAFYAVIALLLFVSSSKASKSKGVTADLPQEPLVRQTTNPGSAQHDLGAKITATAVHGGESQLGTLKAENGSVPPVTTPSLPYTPKTYRVTGTDHYLSNLLSLATENEDFDMSKREMIDAELIDEKVWRYDFLACKAQVVPEPENPYDKNAIKVIVNDLLVGYIKQGSCAHLLKVIRENRIMGIDCTIGGGPYKEVYEEEYDYDRDEPIYEVEKGETKYSVTLTIYEANP